MKIRIESNLKDLKAILDRLCKKYGKEAKLGEVIKKEYGKENVNLY